MTPGEAAVQLMAVCAVMGVAGCATLWTPALAPIFLARTTTITFSKLGSYGRLGNQLFQIASVVGMARAMGWRAVFPTVPTDLEETVALSGICRAPLDLPVNVTIHGERGPTTLEMPCGPADECGSSTGRVVDCRGYFQHQGYFAHVADVADEIRAAFRIRPSLQARVAPHIGQSTVGVHVRRGDYEDVLPAGYYEAAAAALVDAADPHVLVCSDDIAWCRKHLQMPRGWRVTWSPWTRDIEDFAALTACPAMVMSNSSFSWWAAWLGAHPRGVIMPWPWFGSAKAWKHADATSWNDPAALQDPRWRVWTVRRDRH
jgi:hypothetical protein